jgi:hypothetical protein
MKLSKREVKEVKRRRALRLRKERKTQENAEIKAIYITCLLRKKGLKESTWYCKVRFE